MSSRKPRTRRKTSARQTGGKSLWPWLLALVVVGGGIQAYEHRDSFMPAAKSRTAAPAVKREASVARPKPAFPAPSPSAPVPPRSVPAPQSPEATVPAPRPETAALAVHRASGTFAFCGRSGLTNCVADGNTFWVKGAKVRIAGIEAPQTEQAKCASERQKGFAAKVRLRDLLNAGAFELGPAAAQSGTEIRAVHRGGKSIGEQLVSEGLAHASNAGNQPWC